MERNFRAGTSVALASRGHSLRSIRPVTGWLALGLTIALWSSFALSSRGIGQSSLSVLDAAFLRFVTPAVVLLPLLPGTWRAARRERPGVVALLLVGGLPHFLVFAFGAHLTSAALTGMLVPGTVPLFVTVLALVSTGMRAPLRPQRVAGLVLITAGVTLSGLLAGGGASLAGVGLLLAGGAGWAVFTTGLQATKLTMGQMVTSVCWASSLACVALGLAGVLPSRLLTGSADLGDVVAITVLQGIGTGLLSTLCYAFAVRALGGGLAAVSGAVSPVLTAVVAVPVFGEGIGPGLAVALALIVSGVALHNATVARSERRREPDGVAPASAPAPGASQPRAAAAGG